MRLTREAPILVAVDFSAGSDEAFEWAVDLAKATGAPLHVLHVAHDPLDEPGRYVKPGHGEDAPIEEVATERLAEYMERWTATRPVLGELESVRTVVVVGLPATRILEVARRDGAQLIVMGAKGRTALAEVLLGSKTERVTQLSPVPVVVIRGAGT